jgi:putative nucleotidyltransferase with HDIG domain
MRLGFYEVYCVVAALVAVSAFSIVKPEGGLDLNLLWRHSAIAAVAASKIAKHLKEPPAVAFTAGLLHDIGKLIFASVENATYARLVQENGDCGHEFSQAEQMFFGLSHADLGARLLARWDLPEKIVAAVQQHHAALSVEGMDRLAVIVRLANAKARLLATELDAAKTESEAEAEAMIFLGLTEDDLPEIMLQT